MNQFDHARREWCGDARFSAQRHDNAKLGIDLEDVRTINPDIIYVRGSGFGSSGPDSEKGGYDSTAFWARGGSALATTPTEFPGLCKMPAAAYGERQALASGELDSAHDVGRAPAANYQRRLLVVGAVPDRPRFVVSGIPRPDQFAT